MLTLKYHKGDVLKLFFFFQAEDGIRDKLVTGVQTCALPISPGRRAYGAGRPAGRHRRPCGRRARPETAPALRPHSATPPCRSRETTLRRPPVPPAPAGPGGTPWDSGRGPGG